MMGCGASKAVTTDSSEGVEPISSSITQIRDMAPLEVADTGAHPPSRDDPLRRNLYFQRGKEVSLLPGVIPDSNNGFEAERQIRHSGSLIKRHPPKRAQRLEEQTVELMGSKVTSPEPQIQE